MLPENTIKVLKQNLDFCSNSSYNEHEELLPITEKHKSYFIDNFSIKNMESAFVDYYSIVAFPPLGKGEELYTLDQILNDIKPENQFHDTQELPAIGKRYIQFTSIEGEGSYFYDVETDAVYNVNWGEEKDMISGKKQPWFKSFYEFLEWYYSE